MDTREIPPGHPALDRVGRQTVRQGLAAGHQAMLGGGQGRELAVHDIH